MATQTLTATATSDGSGNITFPRFAQAPRGSVLQGTVSIPTAPLTAQFAAVVQGLTIGSFSAYNPWGPIQTSMGQTLQVTGTGLAATTTYTAVWVVGQYSESAAPAPPIPYGSITQISNQTTNPVVVQVVQLPAPPAAVSYSINTQGTGSAVTLGAGPLTIGLVLLADVSNTNKFYVGATNVTTGSAYLGPGQGVVLPVQNANEVGVLGSVGDYLSVWGA